MRAKLLKDMAELSAGIELEVVDSYCGTNGFYYTCKLPKGNQITINSNFVEITDFTPYINWEQRRYEIAKAALHDYTRPREERYISDAEYAAIVAVEYADELIKRLKNETKENL